MHITKTNLHSFLLVFFSSFILGCVTPYQTPPPVIITPKVIPTHPVDATAEFQQQITFSFHRWWQVNDRNIRGEITYTSKESCNSIQLDGSVYSEDTVVGVVTVTKVNMQPAIKTIANFTSTLDANTKATKVVFDRVMCYKFK